LREFVENHRRKDMRDLKGKISFRENYDYKSSALTMVLVDTSVFIPFLKESRRT
jgi:hypothetical protein